MQPWSGLCMPNPAFQLCSFLQLSLGPKGCSNLGWKLDGIQDWGSWLGLKCVLRYTQHFLVPSLGSGACCEARDFCKIKAVSAVPFIAKPFVWGLSAVQCHARDPGLIPRCAYNYRHHGAVHVWTQLTFAFCLDGLRTGWKVWATAPSPYCCLGMRGKGLGDLSCVHHDPEGLTVTYYMGVMLLVSKEARPRGPYLFHGEGRNTKQSRTGRRAAVFCNCIHCWCSICLQSINSFLNYTLESLRTPVFSWRIPRSIDYSALLLNGLNCVPY